MSNNTSNISVPLKGMQTDLAQININEQSYPFAFNAIAEDFFPGNQLLLGNEPSNRCAVVFPPLHQVVGFVEVHEQNRTIYILKNVITGSAQIGEVINCSFKDRTDIIDKSTCDTCQSVGHEITPLEQQEEQCYCEYRTIAQFNCNTFSVLYPVDIEYKITNCSLNIYFTDNFDERRFLYFNYVNNDLTQPLVVQDIFKVQIGTDPDNCDAPIYSDEIDCEKIKVHPNYDQPCVEFIDFVNGGNLKEGVYQVLIAYSDVYGNPISKYFPASQTIPLFQNQIKFETNNETPKALKFEINNLKTNSVFQYYNIVIAQTIEQFTEFIQVGTFSTTQKDYVYTGYEKTLKRLSPTEVFFSRPFYKTARGVTQANGYLFYTGVKEYNLLNLQPVANTLRLKWQTVAVKEGAYHNARNTFFFHTYQRDEVYAFGIVFEFSNGRESCAFHIPGREATEYDLDPIEGNDVIEDIGCTTIDGCNIEVPEELEGAKVRWKVYNTGSVTASPHEYNESCETDKCWETGEFAYWESIEKYPNVPEIWGDLCGKCIRHHKFPDSCVTHIHDSLEGEKGFDENNYIFPIGVHIDHASVIAALDQAVIDGVISAEDRASITGYRIVRGNRVANKSIDAKGLLFNMFKYTKFEKDYYFPNYPYNDLSEDDFLDDVSLDIDEDDLSNRFTFHSPDIHFVNSGLGNILKLETEEYGKSEGYFTHSECQAKHRFLNTFAHIIAFGFGIAAAISATGEKQCRVITYKADQVTQAYDVNADGSAPYGNVHAVLTALGGTISTTAAHASWDSTAHIPDVTTTNNNADGNENPADGSAEGQGTDPITGAPVVINNYESQQITYCTGQTFQIFNSDTFIGTILGGANKLIQRTLLGIIEMNKILDTLRELIPFKNYSVQYNSVGKYNNYLCVPEEGNKVRLLDKTAYLDSYIQSVDEPSENPSYSFNTIRINNWNRESSVYLKTNIGLTNPITVDNSKCSMRNSPYDVGDLDKTFERDIASYYCSVKREILNQYGQLCNIEYLETNSCSFKLETEYSNCQTKVFGGDTFINRFALKRKMPFFTRTACKLPNESDIIYSDLFNVGSPKYYFNTPQPLLEKITSIGFFPAIFSAITSDNVYFYDVSANRLFHQDGYAPLFAYGIPYFLVESDINVDYRHGQNNTDKDFYPHNKDLKTWLEEEIVPIKTDNYYFYNRTYSKQNHESTICTSCILNPKDLVCDSINYNRLIYSEPLETEAKGDNWNIFKANNFWDFELTLGKLITADGIESDKVLVRLEKGTKIFNAYNTIQTTEENIQVGTGGIFQSRPKDIAITTLGYAGTQHRDILHTEFGHIWADAERGHIFNLSTGGSGIDEISKDGMRAWFKENLPFRIKKDFPQISTYDLDNNLNGLGLHYCFDKRFSRILITKLDYKVINSDVFYDINEKGFFIPDGEGATQVDLKDKRYFCDKSWTISYNFYNKSWTSFHSYKPDFYVEDIDTFSSSHTKLSGITVDDETTLVKTQKVYTHNASNKSYQVFYGKLEPFIIEYQSKQATNNNYLNSIEFDVDIIRYHNEFDTFYNQAKTFNKAIVYNNTQTSGLLNLIVDNPENLAESYPKRVSDGFEILTTNSEGTWRFNDFYDISANQYNNVPLFNYDCANVRKTLNTKAVSYAKKDVNKPGLRHKMCRIQLINDKESNYKFIFNFSQINQRQSVR